MRPSIAHQPFGPCRTSGTSRTMGFALAGGTPADRHEYLWRRTDGIPYARARTAAHPSRGRVNVSGRSQDRDPVGQGRKAERDPHPGWPPPLPRVGGPGSAAGRHPVPASGRLTSVPLTSQYFQTSTDGPPRVLARTVRLSLDRDRDQAPSPWVTRSTTRVCTASRSSAP